MNGSIVKYSFYIISFGLVVIWIVVIANLSSNDVNASVKVQQQPGRLLRTPSPTFTESKLLTQPTDGKSLLIVLGNEPLDDLTPSADTMSRVKVAVEYFNAHKDTTTILFTGGPTAGKTTEARMMMNYATSLAVPMTRIILEEKARSTQENAVFSAKLVIEGGLHYQHVFIVSKPDHLEWALPIFKSKKLVPSQVFEKAVGLGSTIDIRACMDQMEKYVESSGPNKARVAWRLSNLKKGIRGID